MSELDSNINISEVLQIIKFSGDSLKFVIKGAKQVKDKLSLKNMQIKLFLHYHSKAISGSKKLNGMSLHSLEKITGGNYSIINLPTEDKDSLAKFFKTLKKSKIAYAVLPDLMPNNGFSQIAVDPSQAYKLQAILEVYNFDTGEREKEPVPEEKRGKEMSMEEYWETGNDEEKEKIINSAVGQAEKENDEELKKNPEVTQDRTKNTKQDIEKVLKFEKLKERHQSRDYFPVTIDKKMVVAETEKAYVTRVPYSYDKESGNFLLMTVSKEESLKTNHGETILTHMRKDGQTFVCDRDRTNGKLVKNQELYRKHYSEYATDFSRKSVKNQINVKKNVKIHSPKNLNK